MMKISMNDIAFEVTWEDESQVRGTVWLHGFGRIGYVWKCSFSDRIEKGLWKHSLVSYGSPFEDGYDISLKVSVIHLFGDWILHNATNVSLKTGVRVRH